MIAIETRYCGPATRRGARIIATAGNGRRHIIGYPHSAHSGAAPHMIAATELAESAGWLANDRKLVFGELSRGRYVFVVVAANGDQL